MTERTANHTEHLAAAFRAYGRRRSFARGMQLFQKNDEARELYFLEQGRVRAYLLYPDGAERTLCYVDRGNLVGEEVTALPPKRIVCADTADDCVVSVLTREQLLQITQTDREVARELLALYMQKIELLSNWIFYGQFSHNEARIACFLYDHSEQNPKITYTQEQIAAVTGMSRVSVSKCIRRFTESGLIEKGYGYLRVVRRQDLREYFYDQEF